jgi:hypothetical protein
MPWHKYDSIKVYGDVEGKFHKFCSISQFCIGVIDEIHMLITVRLGKVPSVHIRKEAVLAPRLVLM